MSDRFTRTLLLPGLFAAASALPAAPFETIVGDDVDIYLSIRSLAETRAEWAGHPFAELLESPELEAFFEPLLDAESAPGQEKESATEILENEFGLTWDELFDLFPGRSAAAFYNLPELLLHRAERPELVLMAEYAGEPARMEALMQVQFERNAESQKAVNPAVEHRLIEESFMGETLYFDETFDGESTYIEDGYALVDGVFVLATPETRLRSAVEAIKAGPEAPLAANGAYLRAQEESGRGDLKLYVNLEAILPPLNAALLDRAMAGGAAMFGVNARSLDAALALEAMRVLFFDIDLIDEGLSSHSGLVYRKKAGLLALTTYTGEPLPEARYVPEGVFSTSVTNFDLGRMFAQLENLLTTASPMMRAQIDAQLQTLRSNTGVDLRSSVLENFGGDLTTLSILPADARDAAAVVAPEQVIVIGLKDAEALSGAFEALKDMVPGMRGQIEIQDFAGETIHTIRPQPNPAMPDARESIVSYVVTRSHFILGIGQPGLLQEVLSALERGGAGFWQTAEAEILFERLSRPGAISRSYVDLEKLIVPIFQSMVQTSRLGGQATALDMERIPKNLSVPFVLISESNEAEDGLFSRTLILQKEAAQ